MPQFRLTESEYALQKKVESFRDIIFTLEEETWTHLSQVVLLYPQCERIDYLLHSYLSTKLVPFEEYSEEHSFPEQKWLIHKLAASTIGDESGKCHKLSGIQW